MFTNFIQAFVVNYNHISSGHSPHAHTHTHTHTLPIIIAQVLGETSETKRLPLTSWDHSPV